jgi:hypothetical protein
MRAGILLLIVLLTGKSLSGQINHIGRAEITWAIFHPVTAIRVLMIHRACNSFYGHNLLRSKLDTVENGGKADAYRHVFYMAAFAQKMRIKKLRKLGRAHEKTNYRQFMRGKKEQGEMPDSLSSIMDLRNNETGFAIGCNFRSLKLAELSEFVISAIDSGKALIRKRNKQGTWLNCDDTAISGSTTKKWDRGGCLVRSDSM